MLRFESDRRYANKAGVVVFCMITAWILQKFFSGVFNVFYHPLTCIPGPKIAAFTAWYKTYQEVYLGRSWIDVLRELHETYGKIVRVGPNEVLLWSIRRKNHIS